MTIATLNLTRESIWEFVKFFVLFKNKQRRFLPMIYIIGAVLFIITGVIVFLLTKEPIVLFTILTLTLVMLAFPVILMFYMKTLANKLYETNKQESEQTVLVNEEVVFINMNALPFAMFKWNEIDEIYVTPKVSYLLTQKSVLIIIDYKNIIEGNKAELIRLLKSKNAQKAREAKNAQK